MAMVCRVESTLQRKSAMLNAIDKKYNLLELILEELLGGREERWRIAETPKQDLPPITIQRI